MSDLNPLAAALFIVLIAAAFLVSPYFLLAAVAQIFVSGAID